MLDFYRVIGKDKEQKQIERAFTYGIGLNRTGKKPHMSFREQWKVYFHERELRRILEILRKRKGNSVCGIRDPLCQKQLKKRTGGFRNKPQS